MFWVIFMLPRYWEEIETSNKENSKAKPTSYVSVWVKDSHGRNDDGELLLIPTLKKGHHGLDSWVFAPFQKGKWGKKKIEQGPTKKGLQKLFFPFFFSLEMCI